MKPDPALRPFIDQRGRLKFWPTRKPKRVAALIYLAARFEDNRDYTERQVNELLDRWHGFGDHTLLRRELYDHGLLGRTRDGRRY
jgi:hypothetical protein